jgi:pimeloyl-ACP methyl ester carboxylesterase
MVAVMWAIREFDVRAAAASIARPGIILYGRSGPTITDHERFRQSAPKLPIRYFESSGHFPMLDQPEEFAKTVTQFCL